MKIKSISRSERGRYVTLGIDGAKGRFVITGELYIELGSPEVGYELSEEEYESVKDSDERYHATVRALNILRFSDNSRRMLWQKLKKKGFSTEVARATVEDMVKLGYLDEKKQVENAVRRLANDSLLGAFRIRLKLAYLGYHPNLVRAAITELSESGEVDFEKNFSRLVEKKCAGDIREERIAELKYKWGYME